jgi:Rod binding domain-containing protein
MTDIIQNKLRHWIEKVTVRFLGSFTEFLNQKGACLNKEKTITVAPQVTTLFRNMILSQFRTPQNTAYRCNTLTLRMQ